MDPRLYIIQNIIHVFTARGRHYRAFELIIRVQKTKIDLKLTWLMLVYTLF